MSKFGLFGKLTATQGNRDALAEILLHAAASMQGLADCELYVVSTSEEDADAVFVFEVWASEGAHQASLALEATQTLIRRARPMIAGMERISTLAPQGGKGISS